MRSLSRMVALLLLTSCMSNAARVESTKAGRSLGARTDQDKGKTGGTGPIVDNADAASPSPLPTTASPSPLPTTASAPSISAAALAPGPEIQTAPKPELKSACEASKKALELPVFLKESSALIVGLDQVCKGSNDAKEETLRTNMSIIGVACTGSPGFITRRGHSTHDWEVITFGLDLNCRMASPDQFKTLAKQKFGIALEAHNITFIPMMIEYWEFERNNDAGLGSKPTLTASGGGAAQWKKTETKAGSFPIKLYGHSSTFGKDQPVYEAKATLLSKSNQRQFDVQVEDMRVLSADELKSTQDRCKAKTRSEKGCREAFEN